MRLQLKHLSIVAASVVLIGCGGGGGSSTPASGNSGTTTSSNTGTTSGGSSTGNSGGSTNTGNTSSSKAITITEDNQVESLGKDNSIKATVDMGTTPRSLYILLSNYSGTQSASSTITHNAKVVSVPKHKRLMTEPLVKQAKILHAPAYIQKFNSKIKTLLHKNSNNGYKPKNIAVTSAEKSNKSVGDSETFYLDAESTGSTTLATLKKVVSNVSTAFGNKTLNVWVSNDSFGLGCGKSKCVTQAMVDELADNFLKEGADNDIYDWDTNIFGEEWGSDASSKYSYLIGSNDEITILLTDIDGDNSPSGGTMGYFWSKDNYDRTTISGSNERIMFYADAVMFANTDKGDFWQKEMYSTLAHEFQHMIHFYEKTVLLLDAGSDSTDTWINEMLSETTEDLVATKIQHTGPRGVAYTNGSAGSPGNTKGRYPLFNENNTLSLTELHGPLDRDGNPTMSLADYSKVNAFGTFLTRNYGGAKVLHDIMYNKFIHEDAIMDAVHKYAGAEDKTFDDLLREWGIAVMLSDNDNLAQNLPTYNTGDFKPDD